MKKIVLCVLVLFIALVLTGVAYASKDTQHDVDLKEVFWGENTNYKDTEELEVLQWAAYFALDCTAKTISEKSDEEGLAFLRDYGIRDVPQQVAVFRYKENKFINKFHERYTHMGWNLDYANDPYGDLSNWKSIRKPLLINAVRQVFLKGKKDLWSTVDFAGWFHQHKTSMTEQQIDSMAALIYYVHVLGDHCYNSFETVKDRLPLARKTENETNPSLIYDLKKYLRILFAGQLNSSEYRMLIARMDMIQKEIRALLSNNDYPLEAQYPLYQEKASELMDELKKRIPRIMEDSDFLPGLLCIEPAA